MILVNSEGFELEEGFKNDVKPEVTENLKGKFNKDEALVLIGTGFSLMFVDEGKRNKDRLLLEINDFISLDYGKQINVNIEVDVDRDALLNKVQSLNDDEILGLIQIIFECNKDDVFRNHKFDEVMIELFGL